MASAISVNKVSLLGNLGQDPEMKTTPQGKTVCKFSIATSDNYKDQSGNWVDNTDWHNVTAWERLAERVGQQARKGSKVYVEGKLKHNSYEKDGITRYFTEVRADQIIILDKQDNQGGGGYQQNQGGYQQQNQNQGGYGGQQQGGYNNPPQAQQKQAPTPPPAPEDNIADDFDDDVPF